MVQFIGFLLLLAGLITANIFNMQQQVAMQQRTALGYQLQNSLMRTQDSFTNSSYDLATSPALRFYLDKGHVIALENQLKTFVKQNQLSYAGIYRSDCLPLASSSIVALDQKQCHSFKQKPVAEIQVRPSPLNHTHYGAIWRPLTVQTQTYYIIMTKKLGDEWLLSQPQLKAQLEAANYQLGYQGVYSLGPEDGFILPMSSHDRDIRPAAWAVYPEWVLPLLFFITIGYGLWWTTRSTFRLQRFKSQVQMSLRYGQSLMEQGPREDIPAPTKGDQSFQALDELLEGLAKRHDQLYASQLRTIDGLKTQVVHLQQQRDEALSDLADLPQLDSLADQMVRQCLHMTESLQSHKTQINELMQLMQQNLQREIQTIQSTLQSWYQGTRKMPARSFFRMLADRRHDGRGNELDYQLERLQKSSHTAIHIAMSMTIQFNKLLSRQDKINQVICHWQDLANQIPQTTLASSLQSVVAKGIELATSLNPSAPKQITVQIPEGAASLDQLQIPQTSWQAMIYHLTHHLLCTARPLSEESSLEVSLGSDGMSQTLSIKYINVSDIAQTTRDEAIARKLCYGLPLEIAVHYELQNKIKWSSISWQDGLSEGLSKDHAHYESGAKIPAGSLGA